MGGKTGVSDGTHKTDARCDHGGNGTARTHTSASKTYHTPRVEATTRQTVGLGSDFCCYRPVTQARQSCVFSTPPISRAFNLHAKTRTRGRQVGGDLRVHPPPSILCNKQLLLNRRGDTPGFRHCRGQSVIVGHHRHDSTGATGGEVEGGENDACRHKIYLLRWFLGQGQRKGERHDHKKRFFTVPATGGQPRARSHEHALHRPGDFRRHVASKRVW